MKPKSVQLTVGSDGRELELFLKELEKEWSAQKLLKELERIGQILLSRAVEAPVPTDRGKLAGSTKSETNKGKKEVTIGFNKVYAAFQDGGKKAEQVIKPRKKKFLFLPISKKGRKHVTGRNPRSEGLKQGVDYLLVKKVTVKTKAYGNPVGPNKYFSETLRQNKEFFFKEIARRMSLKADKAAKKSGGSSQ
jgi:hypothetical protein